LSESGKSEKEKYVELINSLRNRRVPDNPDLFTCGSQAKKIYGIVMKELTDTINNNNELTVRVVAGTFGAGKSHLVFRVINEIWYDFRDSVLISAIDVNYANSFADMLEQILQRLRTREGKHLGEIVCEIGGHLASTFSLTRREKLRNTMLEGVVTKEKLYRKLIEFEFTAEIAEKLSECITKNHSSEVIGIVTKDIDCLKALFRLLHSNSYRGICVFLDEFETLDVKSDKQSMLDMLRTLHEAGGNFRSTFMLVLTREVFWSKVKDLCQPLHERWNSGRTLELTELEADDIQELFEKLLLVYEKAGYPIKHANTDEIRREVKEIYDGLKPLGLSRTFRAVINIAIEKVEQNWVLL